MSKRLMKAIAEGKVVVRSKIPGELHITVPSDTPGKRRSILIPPYAIMEIAPKYVEASLLRNSNIQSRAENGDLVVL